MFLTPHPNRPLEHYRLCLTRLSLESRTSPCLTPLDSFHQNVTRNAPLVAALAAQVRRKGRHVPVHNAPRHGHRSGIRQLRVTLACRG